jgi:DNA polymerase-3 subunit gamma/tau
MQPSAPPAPARQGAPLSPARAALEAARNASRGQAAKPVAPASPPPAPVKAEPVAQAEEEPGDLPPWVAEEMPEADQASAQAGYGQAAQKKTESISQNSATGDFPRSEAVDSNADTPFEVTLQPLPSLGWDGNWPKLAAQLAVRGVVQQLAQQSELVKCADESHAAIFHLRVPLATLLSAGSADKLAAALTEHFGKTVRVETELGAVRQTANAQAQADRAVRQRAAEQMIQSDPFVQSLIREFNASIVPGSIKPI